MLVRALLLAAALGSVLPSHEVDVQYGPGGPSSARTHVSWELNVHALGDANASYYWAVEAYFQHASGTAYLGLQPWGNTIDAAQSPMVLFSAFGKGVQPVSGRYCEHGADGGSGLSCRRPFSWKKNETLRFDMRLTQQTRAATTWAGSVTDTSTNETTPIATWKVPASWGLLDATTVVFVEYFSPVASCADQPYARISFGPPVTYDAHGAFPAESPNAPALPSRCEAPYTKVHRVGNGFVVETGDPKAATMKTYPT